MPSDTWDLFIIFRTSEYFKCIVDEILAPLEDSLGPTVQNFGDEPYRTIYLIFVVTQRSWVYLFIYSLSR